MGRHAGQHPALAEGFVLRTVESDEDIDRYVDLNEAVAAEGKIARRLIERRPDTSRQDFLFVIEERTGRVVSTTCHLGWQLIVEGVALRVLMLEMVVTHPDYRRHGLVRAQIEVFHERAARLGVDLTVIQGIPYYYRQFGYGYAWDHAPRVELGLREASVAGPGAPLRARPALPADAAALARLHDIEMARQGIHVARSATYWEYLTTAAARGCELLERPGRPEPAAFAMVRQEGDSLMVDEAGLRDAAEASSVLAALAPRCTGGVVVCGNSAHSLCHEALVRGGTARVPGQWLVRIPNPAALVDRLRHVLERRLCRGGFADAETDVVINLYQTAFRLRVVQGRIDEVQDMGFMDASTGSDGGDLCVPPDAFARLLLGYRSLEQVLDAWPDTMIKAGARALLEALFPRVDSLILMPY